MSQRLDTSELFSGWTEWFLGDGRAWAAIETDSKRWNVLSYFMMKEDRIRAMKHEKIARYVDERNRRLIWLARSLVFYDNQLQECTQVQCRWQWQWQLPTNLQTRTSNVPLVKVSEELAVESIRDAIGSLVVLRRLRWALGLLYLDSLPR
jgi:hypothetical protein